jgi:hypothetical protein
MRRAIFCVVVYAVGICLLIAGRACAQDGSFAVYTAADQKMNVTLEYPSGWDSSEVRGTFDSYSQAVFHDVHASSGDLSAGIVLTVEEPEKVLSGAGSLAEFMTAIVDLRRKLPGYQELSRSSGRLLDEDAVVFECAYKVPGRLHGKDISLVLVREKILVVMKNRVFYTLRYLNTESEFEKLLPAFDHVAQSARLNNPA